MITYTADLPRPSRSTHAGLNTSADLYAYDRENQTKRWFKSGQWNNGRDVTPKKIATPKTKITKYDHKAYCARMFELAKRNNPKLGGPNGSRGNPGKAGNS